MSVRCPDCGALATYGQELGHRSTCPSRIVGHKTIATGERTEHGFPAVRHEPLTQREADELWAQAEKAEQERAARMPDVQSAIRALTDAHTRLIELGWREAIYCPKDGSFFEVIEAGSTGIHRCAYRGEWPDGSWDVYADGDVYPSHPVLFRLYPEDQAKEDARRKEAAAEVVRLSALVAEQTRRIAGVTAEMTILDKQYADAAAAYRRDEQLQRERAEAAEARVAALKDALMEYGEHKNTCALLGGGICSCGYFWSIVDRGPGAEDLAKTQRDRDVYDKSKAVLGNEATGYGEAAHDIAIAIRALNQPAGAK